MAWGNSPLPYILLENFVFFRNFGRKIQNVGLKSPILTEFRGKEISEHPCYISSQVVCHLYLFSSLSLSISLPSFPLIRHAAFCCALSVYLKTLTYISTIIGDYYKFITDKESDCYPAMHMTSVAFFCLFCSCVHSLWLRTSLASPASATSRKYARALRCVRALRWLKLHTTLIRGRCWTRSFLTHKSRAAGIMQAISDNNIHIFSVIIRDPPQSVSQEAMQLFIMRQSAGCLPAGCR